MEYNGDAQKYVHVVVYIKPPVNMYLYVYTKYICVLIHCWKCVHFCPANQIDIFVSKLRMWLFVEAINFDGINYHLILSRGIKIKLIFGR